MLDTLNDICADYGLTPVGIRHALDQYKKVIYELTNGRLSKLTYNGDFIIGEAEDRFKKDYEEDHGWISVKDRLPEVGQKVLTYSKYGHVSDRTLERHGGQNGYDVLLFSPDGMKPGTDITHWMSLSEPPKGVNTDAAD